MSSENGARAGRDFTTYSGFRVPGNGALIAFCGVDGSGKTTQLTHLAERLRRTHPVFTTQQPTSAFRTDPLVRAYLDGELDGRDPELCAQIGPEFALFDAADRYRHLRTVVMPRLRAGDVVLTDRYVFSCYTSAEPRGFTPLDWAREINRYIPPPDLTIVLDVPARVALERIRRRRQEPKWEELDEQRIDAIRAAYAGQAWGADPRYHLFDGTRSPAWLAERIAALADRMLCGKGLPGIPAGPAAPPPAADAVSVDGSPRREA